MINLKKFVALLTILLLFIPTVMGQKVDTSADALEKLLGALANRADNFEHSLPDFIAIETLTQQTYQQPENKLLENLVTVSRLIGRQLQITKKGRQQLDFQETRQVQTINGKEVKTDRFKSKGPEVAGTFSSILVSHFSSDDQKDFSFDLDPELHNFEGHTAYLIKFTNKLINRQYYNFEGKRLVSNQEGQAWIDKETLAPLRIEYKEKNLPKGILSLSYIVNYATVQIGEENFLLPIEAASEIKEKKIISRINQRYSDYKKFSTDVNLD